MYNVQPTDKVYIYYRLGGSSGVWYKYYKRSLTFEKAKIKLAKLRSTQMNFVFCIALDGWILEV